MPSGLASRNAASDHVIALDDSPEPERRAPRRGAWRSETGALFSRRDQVFNNRPFRDPNTSVGGDLLGYDISGFSNKAMNGVYSIEREKTVGGRQTYWAGQGTFFMYFEERRGLWQISRRWESLGPGKSSTDLFAAARMGDCSALAVQVKQNKWREFSEGRWLPRELDIDYLMIVGAQETQAPLAIVDSSEPSAPKTDWKPKSRADIVNVQSLPDHCFGRQKLAPGPIRRDEPEQAYKPRRAVAPKRPDADPSEDRRRVWIGWFPSAVTIEEILEFLHTREEEVDNIEHKCSLWSSAIVHYRKQEDADAAVQYEGKFLRGRKVQVGYYQEAEETPEQVDGDVESFFGALESGEQDGQEALPLGSGEAAGANGSTIADKTSEVAGASEDASEANLPAATNDGFWGDDSPVASADGPAPTSGHTSASALDGTTAEAASDSPKEGTKRRARIAATSKSPKARRTRRASSGAA